jgi:hypothetical protein
MKLPFSGIQFIQKQIDVSAATQLDPVTLYRFMRRHGNRTLRLALKHYAYANCFAC